MMSEQRPITFYHAPQSRSIIVHWMLEELEIPYQMRVLNLKKDEHKQASYLAINPMGKVPAITHGDVAITEAAAICCYLADAFPAAGLSIGIGDPRRGPYLKWLFFGPSVIEPALVDRMFRRAPIGAGATAYGEFDNMLGVVANAVTVGPYLFGQEFTAADVAIGSQLQWGMMTGTLPARAEFTAYVDRLKQRPALQRVYAKDAELVAAGYATA
jgi:glutathione S-transferase